ncbi:MAG: tetratricopeptide repeat protein, partial [Myxococcota bacterium]
QATCSKLLSAHHLSTLTLFVHHASQRDPKRRDLYFYVGLGHLRDDDHAGAVDALAQVPASSELYLESRAKLAISLSELNRHAEAVAALDQALHHNPDTVQLWSLKAALQERAKQPRAALRTLEQAAERFPDQPQLHDRIAAVAWELAKPRRARIALERKLELIPNDIQTLNFLGYLLAEQGTQLSRAEALLQQAIALRAQPDGTLSDTLGWIYHRMGRHADAIAHLETAVSLLPGEPRVLEHLGDAYHATGQVDLALAHYRRALKVARGHTLQKGLRRKIKTLSASR